MQEWNQCHLHNASDGVVLNTFHNKIKIREYVPKKGGYRSTSPGNISLEVQK